MTRRFELKRIAALLVVLTGVLVSACGREDPASLIGSAKDYQAKGDHQAAIIQLRNVLQKQPENGDARLMLGNSALIVGDTPTAAKEFRKALEYGQPEGTVLPLLATALLQSGNADEVIKEFAGKKLADAKASAELQARVGDAYLATRKTEQAAAAYASALESDPSSIRALLGQTRMMAAAGKLDEAGAATEKVVAANPRSADALVLLAEIKSARGDRAGAQADLQRAVDASPSSPGPRMALITALIGDGQFDAATTQIAAARTARVSELGLQYSEALIAYGKKDYVKASEIAQQALKKAPSHVPFLTLLGSVEYQNKQYGQAISHLQTALSVTPKALAPTVLLARSYLASGKPARAVEVLAPFADSAREVDPAILLLIGEAYFANGDLKQAAAVFERASRSKGQEPMAQTRLGQIALASGDVEGGVRKLEHAAAEEGAPIQAEMALLTGYLRQGNTAKALEVARGMVSKRPSDPMAYGALGSVHLVRKEASDARAAFNKAVELSPTYMPAVASLAQMDLQEHKMADAQGRFESVLLKDPKNEAALLGLAEMMARAKAPSKDIAAVLQRAVAAQPESVGARLGLINLYLLDRDHRAALSAAQEASAALPGDSRILDALGRAQFAAGDTNQAVDSFNRLAAAEPKSPAPLLRLASVHMSRKEPDKAAQALVRAQQLAPSDPNIARDLAVVYASMGKTDDALKQAKGLQLSAPQSAAGHILEGDIQANVKKNAEAEKAYRDGLKAEPASGAAAAKLHNLMLATGRKADADSFARKWMVDHPKDIAFRNYVAERALRDRDFKVAASHYQVILEQQPDNVVVLNNLAWSMGQLGDPKALGYAERALKIAPESASVLDTMGSLLVAKGDTAKGLEYMARAVQLAPDRHDIRLNYAKALQKAGRAEDARKELTQLQSVSQDFPGKAEVADLLKK